jgi:cellulose synthase operon protein C
LRTRLVSSALLVSALAGSVPAGAFVWPSDPAKIARALEKGDTSERRAAALRIAEMGLSAGAELLDRALGDSDQEVRLAAAETAMRLRSAAASDRVVPWLTESDTRIRLAACAVIRHAPTARSVSALGRVLGDPDAGVRKAAAMAMGASGTTDAVGPLLGHLDDPSPGVRAEVAEALARIGDASAAVPLIGKVGDSAPEVRRAAIRALGQLGDRRASSALVLALRDAVPEVRIETLCALGQLGADDAAVAIAALLEEKGSPEIRSAALGALGRIKSVLATRALVKALAIDDPGAPASPVRDALAATGSVAEGPLLTALAGNGPPNLAAGAALALGAMRSRQAAPAIVAGMRRGSVPSHAGLRALGMLGDPSSVASVLEYLVDRNPGVRRQAALTVFDLLDPDKKDGRAVEPLAFALGDPKTAPDEREAIVRALGRTGAPSAVFALLPLVDARSNSLRLAALDALGTLGPCGQDAVLLRASSDENATVRLHAALALARSAGQASIGALIGRLVDGTTEDRTALGIAVAGALSRSADEATAKRIELAIPSASPAVRDALLEGLGRMRSLAAGAALRRLLSRAETDADRAKIAEALAGHPGEIAALVALFSDAAPCVRANAVWAAGLVALGAENLLEGSIRLLSDPDVDTAANAAGAVALVAHGLSDRSRAAGALCAALGDWRPYVRANALSGLGLLAKRCDDGKKERELLAHDPSEVVRAAAARLLVAAPVKAQGARSSDDPRALARCVADDQSGMVATICGAQAPLPNGNEPMVVFVVPDGRTTPMPRAPFSVLRADGLIRSGLADRRGGVFESAAPKGTLSLIVPGALAL